MNSDERTQRLEAAAEELDRQENRSDGSRVVRSLSDGLNVLRDLFYTRAHVDVEKAFGPDSMLVPVSAMKTEMAAKSEIELYAIVECSVEARQHGFVRGDELWCRQWLGRLRLGDRLDTPQTDQRLNQYFAKQPDDRRRSFSTILERVLPEAQRAPLIMYRLLPLAVSVVTCVAFGDHARAAESRKRQTLLLSNIRDCTQCRGSLLENGEKCQQCGNPFWKHEWLTSD